jgi:ATPase family associated with various cellular activities (AAA)
MAEMVATETVTERPVSAGVYTCALAALAALLPESDDSPEAEFLRRHVEPIDHHGSVTQLLDSSLRQQNPVDAALLRLAAELKLRRIELIAVALAAAVETDLMCGRAVAHLQAPMGGSRPTLGLLASALADFESDGQVVERLITGAAVGSGLLQLLNEGSPLSERAVAVPVPLCLALSGRDAAWPATTLGLNEVAETPLPASVLAEAARQAHALEASQNVLVVRSAGAAEGRAVASEISAALGCRPLFLGMERTGNQGKATTILLGLGPLLFLRRLLPVFCFELGPGERRIVPSLPFYSGPALALCGQDGSVEARGESPSAWRVAVPPRQERRQLWKVALGDDSLADELASNYRHSSGRIAQLGRLAHQRRRLDGRQQATLPDIAAAAWTGLGPGLESLAQPLPDHIPDEALVASNAIREELHRLLLRCRRRESMIDGLGASALARYHPGVRALFTGPSGTGKTLAAGWLAAHLGWPLYRADLASLTSKYIGETEKNLAQLLALAEESGIVLLFDEADSLFGKRTEVKESNDRFANAQTNYLLQRIETFDGIALLTSNSRARFDPAFCRRLDMILEFPLPGPEERRLLWLSHLGTHHRLANRELNQLAVAADMAGGHIRNAVLTAAVLAQVDSRPIQYQDVLVGLSDEYRKLNRQMPPELCRNP